MRRPDLSNDHALMAAIPTVPVGPLIGRARQLPGSYWPLRSPLVAPDCNVDELAYGLKHTAARGLGAVWRVGPARQDDPSIELMIEAAHLAGWRVLSRPAGTSWLIDLDRARQDGLPRPSVAKKLRAAWRRLGELGTPHWRHVRGEDWTVDVMKAMGAIEEQSWISRTTNGSGAKFMTAKQRALWLEALTDPVLAHNLSATILMLDDRPITFSFDLDDGPLQYSIAGSYVEDLKRVGIGKLANYRALEDAINDGQQVMDMGAGDTGYKQEMGAVEGYRMVDLLFVRSRMVARVLAPIWSTQIGAPAGRSE